MKNIKGNSILSKIKNIEENFFAVCRYWGNLNSSLNQTDSIVAMSTGVRIADINWAFNEKPLNKDNEKHIYEIKKYYEKLNLSFWWWVYPCGQSPDTDRILRDAGLRLYTKVSCMAAKLSESLLDCKMTDKIKVLPVKNKKDLLVWKDISFDGFEMPPYTREQYGAFVLSFKLDSQSPQKFFLAYLDEKPVATSLLFFHKNIAGLYYVSTLPTYRNRGYGLKITQAAMQSAKESGFTDIILQATPVGARVYKSAGFMEYGQAEIYSLDSSFKNE
ncbi:MAG: GNAT family N-acetyltransferase [Syntrophaceae bacterium]|nr:GNAT family N-acetyltransferase [Syntrophaceae bacterium]